MDADDQLKKLKQIPPLTAKEKREKIMTAILLGLAALLSMLFFVYGQLQRVEANKQRVEAKYAEQARSEAEKQRQLAEEALENCRKSNK